MATPNGTIIPTPDPAVIAAAVAEVKEVFATSFIGFAVSTTAYGISILQAYLYFRNYPKDQLPLKLTVGALWILDTLSTIMIAHSLYTYFVLNFGNMAADALVPWSFALENGLLTAVTLIAQCYYSWQIWTISRNIYITGIIFLLAIAAFGLGLYVTVHLFLFPTVESIGTHLFQAVSGPVQAAAGACDILIMVALVYFLRSKRRTNVRRTEEIIDTLVLYAMCRGILTAITQIMFLVLNLAFPTRTFWQPFHQLISKVYVNSILASLNVRKVIRGKGEPERGDTHKTSSSGMTNSSTTMHLEFLTPKPTTDSAATYATQNQAQPRGSASVTEDLKAEI
ncbi:hypothetical protein R3P38DRAFT_3127733 [Favolaschia claudopus]|uniref:DUF6534 domain-containing protein n=1 Tax=Favolaschia claudopus TaxID=2862362 RepID=A0AAV9ZA04_9AGAR